MRCQLCGREGKAKVQKFPMAVFRPFKKEDGSTDRRLVGYVCRVCIRRGKLAQKMAREAPRFSIPVAVTQPPTLGAI